MNSKQIIVFGLLISLNAYIVPQIRILYTAALIDEGFELRKNQYTHGCEILKNYGYSDPYIVEAIKKSGPTFLENFSTHVFYSKENNPVLKNKGVNEAKTMLEALKAFNFAPDDMIIKITGRYHFMTDEFIRMVENSPEVDGFFKKVDGYEKNDKRAVISGCFALRCHYLIDMLEHVDYDDIEKNMICFEFELADYVKQIIADKQASICYVDMLQVSAHVWGNSGYCPGTLSW